VKTNIGNVKHFPVPPQHRNCDIKGKKDAQSALNRASSLECKELIHNITCLQQAGLLYDTDLRRECGVKTNGRKFEAVSIPEDTGGPTAKIVFLFSLHGRAFRQVKRLFKAVYHRDHYYFVHIDSRSDYLHRKLYEAFSDFPNVYFPTWRIATIWGGASLLQMLLRSLEDLEYILTNWKWDYFINLSESDYPLRTNGELVNFLKAHNGDNFVKTHGADIKKFVQKQGLDRTFVECDNHMWRVDNRKLPGDITVDGGSDWIAIHRNYSRYLVTDRSRFLTGLKRYYEFSLLPAEVHCTL
jgi:protein xylosyltransferase